MPAVKLLLFCIKSIHPPLFLSCVWYVVCVYMSACVPAHTLVGMNMHGGWRLTVRTITVHSSTVYSEAGCLRGPRAPLEGQVTIPPCQLVASAFQGWVSPPSNHPYPGVYPGLPDSASRTQATLCMYCQLPQEDFQKQSNCRRQEGQDNPPRNPVLVPFPVVLISYPTKAT